MPRFRHLVSALVLCSLSPSAALLESAAKSPEAAGLQTPAPAPRVPTVGEVYRNIQVLTDLKDRPTGDLWNVMQFIAGSLSVNCAYCHASQSGPFESDAKQTKRTAREMIRMVRDINNTSFGGRSVVTCNTCHHGSPHPTGTPIPWYKTAEEIAAYQASVAGANVTSASPALPFKPGEPAAGLPDAGQVLASYRKAVGADGVKSLRIQGVNEIALAPAVPFEFEALLPGRASLNSMMTQGMELRVVLNGDHAFRVTSQGTSQLSAAVVRKNNVEFMLPVKYETADAPRTVTGVEVIGSKRYYVVESRPPGLVDRLYFDAQSGLLFKLRTDTTTAFGTKVEERVFEDYRTVNGLTLPYLISTHYMEQQGVFRISKVETNVEIDPARFEPPAARRSIVVDSMIAWEHP